jgi:hypothetical protein
VPLRALRGFGYLRELLRRPGQPVAALDLAGAGAGAAVEAGLGDLLDTRALKAYRQRLRDLEQELTEAENWSDIGRLDSLRAERDALLHELARARRLVAASGTAGMKVTVWDVSPSPEGAIKEAAETVQALRELGYRASLRLLPPSTYFAVTSDSRNHAQVIDGGWSADYASADDFIGKLICAYFRPRR